MTKILSIDHFEVRGEQRVEVLVEHESGGHQYYGFPTPDGGDDGVRRKVDEIERYRAATASEKPVPTRNSF